MVQHDALGITKARDHEVHWIPAYAGMTGAIHNPSPMSITVVEKWESRRHTEGENASAELTYLVIGTDNDLLAKSALRDGSYTIYDGLVRQSYSIDERVAEEIWLGTVRYGRRARPETGESTFQFETGGGTHHVTQSLETKGNYAPEGKTAPDFQGAIGVTDDAVEGVDITVPIFNFSETHFLPSAAVTQAYVLALYALTGRINQGAFRGFAAGEVLFLGASGSKRGEDDWEISFRFAASLNVEDLVVGDIEGINKGGWDYLWCRYQPAADEEAKMLVQRPTSAHVERVYAWGNFALLGIG